MKITISACLLASVLALVPMSVSAQQAVGGDKIQFICRDAGLGKFGVVAKKLINSAKAAAATAGVGGARIKIKSVVDVDRPTLEVSRSQLRAGDIPVKFNASPLTLDFGESTVSVVSPNDQACNVTRKFTIEIKRGNGETAIDEVVVMSPGVYKRLKVAAKPPA